MTAACKQAGPLAGVRVLEVGGVGPVPFCAMYLADLGADVIRIERPLADDDLSRSRRSLNLTARGKRSIAMDIRDEAGRSIVLDLMRNVDIVMEGFRPGVLERLGLGPADAHGINPAIVFGRMSGWGNRGPMANAAGHDINYLAMAGLLSTIGAVERPIPPLNIVGDFGGALYLVTGLLAALTSARASGVGQVVDASILGGTIALMTQLFAIKDHGQWHMEREANWLDGGAPFYRTYETSDGKFIAVGAIEPQFYRALVSLLELSGSVDLGRQMDRSTWGETATLFAKAFASRQRDQWAEAAAQVDACCTPVLDLDEARIFPHNVAEAVFVDVGGQIEPAPQPRFSGTHVPTPRAPSAQGADAIAILRGLGRDDQTIARLFETGIVSRPDIITGA